MDKYSSEISISKFQKKTLTIEELKRIEKELERQTNNGIASHPRSFNFNSEIIYWHGSARDIEFKGFPSIGELLGEHCERSTTIRRTERLKTPNFSQIPPNKIPAPMADKGVARCFDLSREN